MTPTYTHHEDMSGQTARFESRIRRLGYLVEILTGYATPQEAEAAAVRWIEQQEGEKDE